VKVEQGGKVVAKELGRRQKNGIWVAVAGKKVDLIAEEESLIEHRGKGMGGEKNGGGRNLFSVIICSRRNRVQKKGNRRIENRGKSKKKGQPTRTCFNNPTEPRKEGRVRDTFRQKKGNGVQLGLSQSLTGVVPEGEGTETGYLKG